MNRRTARTAGLLTLLLAAAAITQPPAEAAPQQACSGAFCVTFDLATNDAFAPTHATTAAGQPTNLALRWTDDSTANKNTWLAKVSAVLGSSSSKSMAVTDPAQLPLGAYVAGSAATASSCAPGLDGSGYATSCPAGFGSGHVELTPPLMGSPEIKTATFGIKSVTVGVGGVLTANLGVFIDGALPPIETATSTTIAYAPAGATTGPSLTMDTRPAVAPPLTYTAAVFSMNTVALNLNGLVTEAAAGAVSPSVPFVRQSLLCTSVTSTLIAHARGTGVVASPFAQTITGCPATAGLVSVVPDPAKPKTFTFTMKPPTAAVPGRTAALEWVFGDGAKATTGATTTHTYPVSNPVVALVTVVDSAGARSSALQVKIGSSAVRGKQKAGDLIKGMLADQDTGVGIADQKVLGFRCATKTTPVASCQQIGSTTTKPSGAYRLRIPEVKKKGFVVVSHSGTATTSVTQPARFGSTRVIDVLPQPDVTLKVSDKRVRPGTTVRLSGTVKPGKKGKTVRLQGFIRGKWRSIAKTTLSQKGTYATTCQVRVPGRDKVKVRALVPGTAATLQATSPVKVIRIER